MKKSIFLFLILLTLGFDLSTAYAEDVKITTYYPSPYGSYRQLTVENLDESPSITEFTEELTQAGLNILTEYANGTYTPGIFWSTRNDNSDNPKAGIWMYQATSASRLHFGTSNNFATGITNNAFVLDSRPYAGIGTVPTYPLDVAIVNGGNTAAKFGPSLPVYVKSGPAPSVGFNATWPISADQQGPSLPTFVYGAGSANNYAATVALSSTTGALSISTYSAPGNAGTEITNPHRIVMDKDGNVGMGITDSLFGSPVPQAALDVQSDGGAMLVPRKSTTGDPAGVEGMIYYNTADDKFRVYEDGTWKDMGTGGGGVVCNSVETTYEGTGYFSLSLTAAGTTRNICEDGNGCSLFLWTTTAAKPAGSNFYENAAQVLHQTLSDGKHYWHFSYADQTGINGDATSKAIISNWSGFYLYDDLSGTEMSYNALTVRDNNATNGFVATLCD